MPLISMSPLLHTLRWLLPVAAAALTGCAVVPAEPAYPGPVVYGGTMAPDAVVVAPAYPAYSYAAPPIFWSPPPPVYVAPPLWYGGGPPYVARPRGHYRHPGARPSRGNGSIGSAIRGVRKHRQ